MGVGSRLLGEVLVDSLVHSGLEGHYKKWSTKLKSALQPPNMDSCDCATENPTTCCKTLSDKTDQTTEVEQNGDDEELRIESDDDDEVGGCKNGNDDIMDLEDMGDYIETSHPTKVGY